MGYRVGDNCYGSLVDAQAAFMTHQGVQFSNDTAFLMTYSAPNWKMRRVEKTGAVTETNVPVPTLVECSASDGFIVGTEIGAAILGVWAAVWAILAIKRALL